MAEKVSRLICLKDKPFIEIYRLEEINDPIFTDYQQYDFYQLLYFTEVGGNLSYFLDFNEYTLENDAIILVFPGQIDRLSVEDKKGYLFAIDREVFFEISQRLNSDYLNGYLLNMFLKPDTIVRTRLKKIQDLILDEYTRENRLSIMKIYMESYLFHIASLVETIQKTTTDISDNYVIPKLMKLINHYFINERNTTFYAQQLGLTNKRLNLLSLKSTGKTIKQHLRERLILETKKEIYLGKKNLKEITFNLGFSDPSYFTRFFKQYTGITPTEFIEGQKVQVKGR